MFTELYLDTARLGRMCPAARRAEQAFAGLVSRSGSGLYLEDFLAHGFPALPTRLQKRLRGLTYWQGIASLHDRLRQMLELDQRLPVFFAGQSRYFLRQLARLLFRGDGDVVATDLDWPPYLDLLKHAAGNLGRRLHVLPLRDATLKHGVSPSDICAIFAQALKANNVSGLFLTDISYEGIRLPISEILSLLPTGVRRPFVVCDGAQAFCHRPLSLKGDQIDAYLTGTQKWTGAYHPLRICFCGRQKSSRLISEAFQSDIECERDGLYDFSNQLLTGQFPSFGETVNLSALITAAAAICRRCPTRLTWETKLCNHDRFVGHFLREDEGYRIHAGLRSGIALWSPQDAGEPTTQSMKRFGVVASRFEPRLFRISMPGYPLSFSHFTTLRRSVRK